MLTRRGFLGTMLAAAAGAVANFDVSKKLWVPGVPDRVADVTQWTIEQVAERSELALPVLTWTKDVPGNQAELIDVAMRFAKTMAPRLQKTKATVLRRMMLEHAGHMDLGLITLTDDDGNPAGRGYYEPAVHRVSKDLEAAHRGYRARTSMEDAADQMFSDVAQFDAFAPIGVNLRDNMPFADCLVGTATDPESGLSARALRFRTVDGVVHTECELAVGNWMGNWMGTGANAGRSRLRGEPVRMLLSPELCAAQEANWLADAAQATSEQDSDGERRDSAGTGIRMRYLKEYDIERGE